MVAFQPCNCSKTISILFQCTAPISIEQTMTIRYHYWVYWEDRISGTWVSTLSCNLLGENAPSLHVDPDEVICGFINEYIKTRIPDVDEELCSLVITLQCHQCSAYCCRKGRKCCFGLPNVWSLQTLIGQQLVDDKLNQKELIKIA